MDGTVSREPAPAALSTPQPDAVPTPAIASCCSTASFPPNVVRSWIGNRRVLAVAGLAVGGSGIALGWDWLTAIGVAPLLLSAAPCLVMCALGLCMMGKSNQACSGATARQSIQAAPPTEPAESR